MGPPNRRERVSECASVRGPGAWREAGTARQGRYLVSVQAPKEARAGCRGAGNTTHSDARREVCARLAHASYTLMPRVPVLRV